MGTPALPLVSYTMIETIGKVRKRAKGRWMVDLRSSGFGRLKQPGFRTVNETGQEASAVPEVDSNV